MFSGAIPQHTVPTTDKCFAALGLAEPIQDALREIGFESPTPVQAEVIPLALSGRDVIGLAQTGSGKTAAFCLPLAQRLWHGRGVRGLILSPTREIALQTQAFLELFGRDHKLTAA
ncbi:MAG TPA: DEAD/DEAH box helicase, partial [Thermoanaerobaculia bacterium]|nr:DEAD/DEAH box helicase [Thermoanaerobaculia bacterium]